MAHDNIDVEPFEVPAGCDPRCVLVSNLNRQTIAHSLHDFFSRFGQVERVEIDLDDERRSKGSAIVLFDQPPDDPRFVFDRPSIDGKRVRLKYAEQGFASTHSWREAPKQRCSMRVPAREFSMGIMVASKAFADMWSVHEHVALIVDYDVRECQLLFVHLGERYRVQFEFSDMDGMMRLERDSAATFLTIALRCPVRVWRQRPPSVTTGQRYARARAWERIVSIPLDDAAAQTLEAQARAEKAGKKPKRAPVPPVPPAHRVDLGGWLALRVKLCLHGSMRQELDKMLHMAAEFNLIPRTYKQEQRLVLRVIRGATMDIKDHLHRARKVRNFNTLYALESAISKHRIEPANVDDTFYDMINELDPWVAVGLLTLMTENPDGTSGPVRNPTEYCHRIYQQRRGRITSQTHVPDHCIATRKVVVTPTTMYITPPVIEVTNRVVRHFEQYADRFLRVQFVDEGMRRMPSSFGTDNNEELYNRVYKVMTDGIQLGTRRYEFLAFSSSQLRGHGCWFFAPTPDLSNKDIRRWMGTFDHVKIVAKHAVRMGQCFSSTTPTKHLHPDQVEVIDDIENNDGFVFSDGVGKISPGLDDIENNNGFVFSDGVGKISPGLAREIADVLRLGYTPSCFQFRLSGAKGVLMVSNYLRGKMIQLRPSQIKFEASHTMFEVIRVARYLPGYLNRQVIILLSALGISDHVFMTMSKNMLDTLDMMLSNPAAAMQLLAQNLDEFGTARSMAAIINAGFLERKDPHIANLIKVFRASCMKNLKEKAKIHVPKGAFLLGVLDDTDSLEEGQVFCQIAAAETAIGSGRPRRTVIQGDCIVFRNPCFHPGDVRVVTAVDCPKLRYLCDVIVFPAKGHRDLPSMMSGGDLDGDDYTLIWDPALIPRNRNYPPQNYTAEPPTEVDKVTISQIRSFFVNYINNDSLGQIANAHLATADMSPMGALDGRCTHLAQLHSRAVDFPKSGKPAILDEDLRVRIFPDFMQKKDKEMYRSEKVLGRMYRSIKQEDYEHYREKLGHLEGDTYDVRLWMPNMERYIVEARAAKSEYNRDILSLMNQYGVYTETELVSGFVMEWGQRPDSRSSTFELCKRMMQAVTSLRKRYVREYFERGITGDGRTTTAAAPEADQHIQFDTKAAAWYYVTYHPNERRRNPPAEADLISFPWILCNRLCDIARRHSHREILPEMCRPLDERTILRYSQGDLRWIEELESEGDDDDDDDDANGNGQDSEDDDDDDDDNNGGGNDSGQDDEDPPVIEVKIANLRKLIAKRTDASSSSSSSSSSHSAAPSPIPSRSDENPTTEGHNPQQQTTPAPSPRFMHLGVQETDRAVAKSLLS